MEGICLVLFALLPQILAQAPTWINSMNGEPFCENLPTGEVFYTLHASGAATYEITTTTFLEFVELNPTSGELKLLKPFDRETQATMTVQLRAIGSFSSDFSDQTSTIIIDDSNDNTPIFTQPTYSADIFEDPWTTTSKILRVYADDADNGNAAAITYSLEDESVIGIIKANGSVLLQPGFELDYEKTQYYSFKVTAADQGFGSCDDQNNPHPLLATASIVLNIKDGPDQPPYFIGAPYNVQVLEGSKVGEPIAQVTAKDRDYGLNWNMEYSILSLNGAENVFQIDNRTGEIKLQQVIDRESQTALDNGGVYSFDVVAKEIVPIDSTFSNASVSFPLNASTGVTVTVLDVNDNVPTFYLLSDPTDTSSKQNQTQYNATIDEGTSNFIAVPGLYIYVQDIDSVENAQFQLSLTKGSHAFEISPTLVNSEALIQLRVKDSMLLDFETNPVMEVEIHATEVGNDASIFQTAFVTIYLTDTNDQSPEFQSTVLTANISEDAQPGAEVYVAKAQDSDSGVFGEIEYTLAKNDKFEISDSKAGNITLTGDLDRELRNIYYVSMTATDGGGRSTTASLEITVLDINDNAPKKKLINICRFQRSSYSALLQENSFTFTSAVLLSATDADEPGTSNSEITYLILDGDYSTHFNITLDGNSQGEIMVTSPIDLESLPEGAIDCGRGVGYINLTVMAIDNGSPQLNQTTQVKISVEDVNDFDPQFWEKNYAATVPEKSPRDTPVMQVNATDDDSCSPNNLLDYQIDVTSSSAFLIDTVDNVGILKVKDNNLDLEVNPVYNVEIFAIDSGLTRRTGTTTVVVTLEDVNDKPPYFVSASTTSVTEDVTVGTFLDEQVQANDTDSDSQLEYSMTVTCSFGTNQVDVKENCTDRFRLDKVNGSIMVMNPLDREHIDTFYLQLQVTDLNAMNNKIQTVLGDMTIIVDDVNDNHPKFVPNTGLRVNEAANNAYVGEVEATDLDIGINAEITYSVTEESSSYIEIDANSGQIYTVSDGIDREAIFNATGENILNVSIVATDNGKEVQLNTTTVFQITIVDINDNDPIFDESTQNASISIQENQSDGTVIYHLSASDLDEGVNAKLIYVLVGSESRINFKINETTGILTSGTGFDREYQSSYEITVKVEDSAGSSSRSSEIVLTVLIDDVDDNEPDFTSLTSRELSTTAKEGTSTPNFFTVPAAEDRDLPVNSHNFYYKVGGTGYSSFDVNKTSGQLSAQNLDRETIDEYDLIVWVTGNPDATAFQTTWAEVQNNASMLHILITVGDVNDNPPLFPQESYEADMPGDTQPDVTAIVLQITATDADIGVNAELTYRILSQTYVVDGVETNQIGAFDIDANSGDIYLSEAIDGFENSYYIITVEVTDGMVGHTDTTEVTILIIKGGSTVTLYSILTKDEFEAQQDEFISQLEAILDAKVFVDQCIDHVPVDEQDEIKSDIDIHARENNSTTLVSPEYVILKINEDVQFRTTFGIVGVQNDAPPETQTDLAYLQAGLIIACAVILLVLIVFATATLCIRRNYSTKLAVASATERAAQEIISMKSKEPTNILPSTNKFAESENPLYDEKGDNQILSWPVNNESNDDDDSIDDNAVDNQDSAIDSDDKPASIEDDNLNDAFDIDFDPTKLEAALNAPRQGRENLTFLFNEIGDEKGDNFM